MSRCNSLEDEFNAAMASNGPFTAGQKFAVSVSGGADSTALALLTQRWIGDHGGSMVALIVDHGLRPRSDIEAELVRLRLETRGIVARIITLAGLDGKRLQEAARIARHAALLAATREAGAVYLLLGHHAGDQSETVAMRAMRGSSGLEGISAWTARNDAVLLRPLLGIVPDRLKEFLRAADMPWVDDPSNADLRFERSRIRSRGSSAVAASPEQRRQREIAIATFLARNTIIRPEGFAIIRTDSIPPAALSALLRIIGGADYAPKQRAISRLATELQPATLGGVRILKAGKLGPGWLLVREFSACAASVPAVMGIFWDRRFKLLDEAEKRRFGPVGPGRAISRDIENLPAAIASVLPCLGLEKHGISQLEQANAIFVPPAPAASLPFQTIGSMPA